MGIGASVKVGVREGVSVLVRVNVKVGDACGVNVEVGGTCGVNEGVKDGGGGSVAEVVGRRKIGVAVTMNGAREGVTANGLGAEVTAPKLPHPLRRRRMARRGRSFMI